MRPLPNPAEIALVAEPAIPVAVLTGFLGSGKTTLIRRLLNAPGMHNSAVVVNEFGEVGLDHLLLETSEEDTVVLPGGCLCCQTRGDLVRALRSLLERRERRELPAYERVIVETSGLADPGPILQTFLADPMRLSRYKLAGLVALVDAVLGADTLARHASAEMQVALADRILISKLDLADNSCEERLRARLGEMSQARIARAQDACRNGSLLFDLSPVAFDRPVRAQPDGRHLAARFDTIVRRIDRPLSLQIMQEGIEALAETEGEELLRLKAVIKVDEDPRPVALHAVQHLVHLPQFLANTPPFPGASLLAITSSDAAGRIAAAIDGLIGRASLGAASLRSRA